jgi:MFS family permease
MLYLFAVVFGLGYGGMIVSQSPIVAELFGLRAHGAILGAVVFGATTGGAIGPLVAGRIFDIIGNYQPVFLIYAGVSIISVILTVLLRPTFSQGGDKWNEKKSLSLSELT